MFSQLTRVCLVLVSTSVLIAATSGSCPAGSFSTSGKAPCTQCKPGTFQPDAGQTSCRTAQAGWFASGSGATFQSICQQGTFSTGGAEKCTACPAGSYCNGQGQTKPQLCPTGHYAPTTGTGQQCLECPKGTFVNFEGATACCTCCSGFYNDQTSQDHCFDCPVRGAFSPAGSTSKDQCANTSGGGLTTCTASGKTCPNTGGSFPSGYKRAPRALPRECARGHQSCPIYGVRAGGAGYVRGHECVDVRSDLESCGGCVADDAPANGERSAGGGRDCSAIPHVDSVTCSAGACVIGRCEQGFSVSADGSRCVRSLSVQAAYYRRRTGM
ncbi:uncharacterized protein TRAVEDRAFT_147597 [Trametes versicolor FP-101664 SS1]|uniref:uncharacterized protein n=1 Tax=Trametes versicolor (strain FP-101664) TaxID=717944 RepID=UPI0004622B20|nr:uncharacterized protein TRAVEDRAFT_147597 [Trametes versicolor FP-101664 SS1]EIW59555.1 hypothetical protein TRAVEDRAFT_147597 [Trametes versicolor FP-101664 SS1]